jgi:trans-aconitate 2-methyltransferase
MTWNPDKYNEFQSEREQPFHDLISHIADKPNLKVLDLGCGTGLLTQILADRLNNAFVLGIDSSAEMLAKAPYRSNLKFEQKTILEQIGEKEKWDIIVSNAALQWVDNHSELFPKIISLLNTGGQLAIQMPQQTENMLNKILLQLAQEEPYATALKFWNRPSPVLTLDDYTNIVFSHGGQNILLYQKVYPIVSKQQDDFYNFISGSALAPYIERLTDVIREQFILEFKKRIFQQFPKVPSIYAFKRIFIYATF